VPTRTKIPAVSTALLLPIGIGFWVFGSRQAPWIAGETIQITGGSRISVGYLTCMHHVPQQLAGTKAEPLSLVEA
jgi:hypothetical protein